MFTLFEQYKNLIVSGVTLLLLIGLYFYIHTLKTQIQDLRSQLTQNQVELANYRLQSERYKNAIDIQNRQVNELKVSKDNALDKLSKWKALPPKIKYRTITKIREVKSNDCKDIKNTINAIRNIDYNSLQL